MVAGIQPGNQLNLKSGGPMPPGNVRTKPPVKVIERATAEACLAIAQKVQIAHRLAGNEAGAMVALQVVESIREELLGAGRPRAEISSS